MITLGDITRTIQSKALMYAIGFVIVSLSPSFAKDIEGQIRWNLSDLYSSYEVWDNERVRINNQIKTISRFQGTLGDSPQSLYDALDTISAINKDAARLYIYASLKADEDTRDTNAQKNLNQALEMFAALEQATLFIAPEVAALGKDVIEAFIEQKPALSNHAQRLNDVFIGGEPIANVNEAALEDAANALREAQLSYRSTVRNSILWPWVTLESGQGLTLTPTAYTRYRAINSRADRKKVFDAFWQAWKPSESRIGRSLNSTITSHISTAKLNGFDSALAHALKPNGIGTNVYRSLIGAVNENLPSLHRYLKLRQRILGIENAQYYDLHAPTTYLERRFNVDDAKALTRQALIPYGSVYIHYLDIGFDGDWMHVYPQPGKRSGAYTQNAGYDVHPYLLLNFNRRYNGVATFAHEWGHAVHSQLSKEQNPIETYSYSPFVGESLSATNEILLYEHMLAQDHSDTEYLHYISQALENISASFFRHTMFAEFELTIHTLAESGEILTGKRLSELYLSLLRKYHGHDQGVMTIDETYAIEWAYISHFFNNYTVYQNATSIVSGALFANRILAGNTKARDSFLDIMRAGGSAPPQELLEVAGIDLTSKEPYDALITRMKRLMDLAELILNRRHQ